MNSRFRRHPVVTLSYGAPQTGFTLVMNYLHAHSPRVCEQTAAFARAFGYQCTANLYVTPPGDAQGFQPHFDTMESFVVQIAGSKRWLVYDTAQHEWWVPQPYLGDQFAFNVTPKLMESVLQGGVVPAHHHLHAGSLFYIPSGWIHEARTGDGFERLLRTPHQSPPRHWQPPSASEWLLHSAAHKFAPPVGTSMHIAFGVEIDTPFTVAGFLHLFLQLLRSRHAVFSAPLRCGGAFDSTPWTWYHILQLLVLDAAFVPANARLRSPMAFFPTALAPTDATDAARWQWIELPHARKKLKAALEALRTRSVASALARDNVCRALSVREEGGTDGADEPGSREQSAQNRRRLHVLQCSHTATTDADAHSRLHRPNVRMHASLAKRFDLPPLPRRQDTAATTAWLRVFTRDVACEAHAQRVLTSLLDGVEQELQTPPGASASDVLREAAHTFERIATDTLEHSLLLQRTALLRNMPATPPPAPSDRDEL